MYTTRWKAQIGPKTPFTRRSQALLRQSALSESLLKQYQPSCDPIRISKCQTREELSSCLSHQISRLIIRSHHQPKTTKEGKDHNSSEGNTRRCRCTTTYRRPSSRPPCRRFRVDQAHQILRKARRRPLTKRAAPIARRSMCSIKYTDKKVSQDHLNRLNWLFMFLVEPMVFEAVRTNKPKSDAEGRVDATSFNVKVNRLNEKQSELKPNSCKVSTKTHPVQYCDTLDL